MNMAQKRLALRRLREMQADPCDRAHGKTTGYQYGCRCKRCRAAMSEYNRRWRIWKKAARETMMKD